jgi:hypothetical protein
LRRDTSTTERPCAAIEIFNCSRLAAASFVQPRNIRASLVYSWLQNRMPSRGEAWISAVKSLLYPNCMACALAVCFSKLNLGAPRRTGSPQRISVDQVNPAGTLTESTVAGTGAIGVNPKPLAFPAATVDAVAGAPTAAVGGSSSRLQAALRPTTPAPPSSVRRESDAVITSPRYSLSLVLGTGWAQASPHR